MAFDLARTDTICALATAPGPSALTVVRVSGRDAADVLARVFRPRRGRAPRAFVATLGDVVDAGGAIVDEALVTRFPEGRSYTGEASFELSLHGGPSRARAALAALVDAGCRLAEPGEFTLRAVLTGRMDLTAAEAVIDVVHARSDEAARAALAAVRGALGARLTEIRAVVVDTLAELEARLDFPDEELPEAARAALGSALDGASDALRALHASGARGRRLVEGARVVLYGAPNVGKSTLFNALLGEARALVHESAGTTRDVLEGELVLDGIPVTLVDVAGVRDDAHVHPVEQLGIARAHDERARADLLLVLARDGVFPDVDEDARALRVLTQIDRPESPPAGVDVVAVSARTGAGVDALRRAIAARVGGAARVHDEVVLTRARQIAEVGRALDALDVARHALARGAPDEVTASELRAAGGALDRVLGRDLDEDVLDEIFRRFCIGK